MATIEIPLRDDAYPAYTVTTTIEDVVYQFSFLWNERESAWYMSIEASDNTVLLSGVKVVTNWDLLRRAYDPRLPQGTLTATDIDGNGDPALADLGTRVKLAFEPSSDVV